MSDNRIILMKGQSLEEKIKKFGFAVVPMKGESVKDYNLAYTVGFAYHNMPELLISDYEDQYQLEFLLLTHHYINCSLEYHPQSIIPCADSCFKLLEPASFIKEKHTKTAQEYYKKHAPQLLDFSLLYASPKDCDGLFEDEKPFSETPYNNSPLFQMSFKVCTSNN